MTGLSILGLEANPGLDKRKHLAEPKIHLNTCFIISVTNLFCMYVYYRIS